jgi:hypothetical protein
MSEHKAGEFIRTHKKAEIATATGAVAVGAGIGIAAAFLRRKRRHHELHTFSGEDMSDRLSIFGYDDEETLRLNLPTRLAGSLYAATLDGDNDGLAEQAIHVQFGAVDQEVLKKSLDDLVDAGFAERGQLHDGQMGYKVTAALVEAALDGASEPLAQYFYGGPGA